jgi:hypothetical protein
MFSGFELNQLLMPAKSGALSWLAAAVTTGTARAASSQMPGMTAPVTAMPISAAETASSLKVREKSSGEDEG